MAYPWVMATVALIPKDAEFDGRAWERQSKWGEGAKAFDAFTIYRDLGDGRTVVLASHAYRKKYGLKLYENARDDPMIYKWSSQFRWLDRVAAWDAFMDAKEIETIRRRRLLIARRQADQAAAIQETLNHPIVKTQERLSQMLGVGGVDELDALSYEELLRLVKEITKPAMEAAKGEREALSVTDVTVQADTSQLVARGSILRKLLATPQAIGMAEEINFAVTQEATEKPDGG